MSGKLKRKRKKAISNAEATPFLFNIFALFVFVLIPLIYVPGTLDGIQPVRLFAISLFLIICGGLLLLGGHLKTTPVVVWHNPLVWLLLAYLFITIASMAWAINVKEAYFDIAKTIAFFVFTLFLAAILFNTHDWQGRITKFIILAACISVAVGIYQFLKFVIDTDIDFLPDGRPVIYQVKGLMAHKNQYSVNLMLMLPMLIYGLIVFDNKLWQRLSLLSTIAVLSMIIILQTRAVWIALFIGSFILSIFSSVFYKKINLSLKRRNLILIATVTTLLLILGTIIFVPARNEFSKLAQLKSIANPEAGNNEFRIKIWKVTTEMIAEHPITGVGAGNWKLHSANYYEGYDLKRKQLNWIRPHNDMLWVFAEKGIFGIIIYAGIFLFFCYYLIKAFFRSRDKNTRFLSLLITGGLISYFIISLFSFPLERINQQIYLHFYIAAAIILLYKTKESGLRKLNSKIAVVLTAVMLFPVMYSVAILQSDKWLAKARIALNTEAWRTLLDDINQAETWARNLDPDATPIDWYKGLAWSELNQPKNALQAYFNAHSAHPNKITVLHNIGIIYSRLNDNENAILYFNKALDISPDYSKSLEALASVYVKRGEYQQTLNTLKRIEPEKRNETVIKNLQATRKIIIRELFNEAEELLKQGKEKEAWQKYDSATRVYYLPDKFLMNLENEHANKFDDQTLLKMLKLVSFENRSKTYQDRINQLKIKTGTDEN
ncbi:MAG: O-antigen ligase family protein [Bacteroidales bacterium]|nr:O-antigen ligase family protein [Bacteroidales bacterium]